MENSDRKKRPRPANLDLKGSNLVEGGEQTQNDDMKDLALKCVSPGLPPLSAKMKSTILISKSIEAQQRHIIASRSATISAHAAEEDSEDDNDQERPIAENVVNDNTPSTSGLSNDMEDLAIPSADSNKRFKRDKAPPPLNLSSAHSSPRPIIKSAPIYNINPSFFTPSTSRRSTFRNRKLPSSSRPITGSSTATSARPRPNFTPMTPFDQNAYYQRGQIPGSAYPYPAAGSYRAGRMIAPRTATALRNPSMFGDRNAPALTQQQLERYQQQLAYQQQQWAKFKTYQESRKVNPVTDVFKGDATRYAPASAQPLSAQRAFFSLDEIKPQTVSATLKTKNDKIPEESGDDEEEDDNDNDDDDPESNAIEPEAEVGLKIRKNLIVKSELKLDNNTFRFNFERVENAGDKDKERFLAHCATAWDQFTRLP